LIAIQTCAVDAVLAGSFYGTTRTLGL